jgi:phage head maturation protease
MSEQKRTDSQSILRRCESRQRRARRHRTSAPRRGSGWRSPDSPGLYSKDYEKNPIVCYAHDSYFSLPIGKCVALKRDDEAVTAKIVFAERPDTYPNPNPGSRHAAELFKQGVMNAFSVGLLPIETAPRRREIKPSSARGAIVCSKWELLEFSVVPVAGESGSGGDGRQQGFITQEQADKMFKKIAELKRQPSNPSSTSQSRSHPTRCTPAPSARRKSPKAK